MNIFFRLKKNKLETVINEKIEIVGTLTGCYKHLPGEGKNRKFQN